MALCSSQYQGLCSGIFVAFTASSRDREVEGEQGSEPLHPISFRLAV